MRYLILLFTVLAFAKIELVAQIPTASEVLDRSIAYHDPKGHWETKEIQLQLRQTTPNRPERNTSVKWNLAEGTFWQRDERGEDITVRSLTSDTCQLEWNGRTTFSESEIKKNRLTCEGTRFWRNYQTYLYGLPMKLKDSGTRLDPAIKLVDWQDQSTYRLRVTYDNNVGKDIWYFYFNPENYALVGYQFFHDESKNDGEYILLKDEAKIGKMRLPKERDWYTNKENKYLGKDMIVN